MNIINNNINVDPRPRSKTCPARVGIGSGRAFLCPHPYKGKRLHTRNQHLGNHRGFHWHFPMDFSGVFQRSFTCQWYVPKDCHLSNELLLELSNGFQWHFSMEFPFGDFWCVIFCPDLTMPWWALDLERRLYFLLPGVLHLTL